MSDVNMSEAERLANMLELCHTNNTLETHAAAELRRLAAEGMRLSAHADVLMELRRLDADEMAELRADRARLAAEVEALREALGFYADESRYFGPNQRLDGRDEWSERAGLEVYRLDVTRDRGAIARDALDPEFGAAVAAAIDAAKAKENAQ